MTNKVVAFYGFKGGAGRSFLLANVAALLAANGRRVLIIDADLEAPGLGDFFDTADDGSKRMSGALFSQWRLKKGILDLMDEVTDPESISEGEDDFDALVSSIQEKLDPKPIDNDKSSDGHAYLTKAGPFWHDDNTPLDDEGAARSGLYLMGAGNHAATSDDGSFGFLRRILDFDFVAYSEEYGGSAFSALKHVLCGDLFDHVFIDGRTGYNTASIIAIQNLATDVVMVGTSSMQSIDGIARMRPVFTGPSDENPDLKIHMVLSKMSGTEPDPKNRHRRANANRIKRNLNEEYFHPGLEFYDFPFVRDFTGGDSLMFARGDIREHENVENYLRELLRLTQALVGGKALLSPENAIKRAFIQWRGSMRSSDADFQAAPDFGKASERDERLQDRDKVISNVIKLVIDYLEAGARDRDLSDTDRGYSNPSGAESENWINRQFLGLYIEERVYVQAAIKEYVEDNSHRIERHVRHRVSSLLNLEALPNLVTRSQIGALGIDATQLPVAQRSKDSDAEHAKSVQGQPSSVEVRRNSEDLKRTCAELMRGTPGDENEAVEKFLEMIEATIDQNFVAVVSLMRDLVLAKEVSVETIGERFSKLLDDGSVYLPNTLSNLVEPNLLQVARQKLLSEQQKTESQHVRLAIGSVAERVVAYYCQKFGSDLSSADESGVRQLLRDLIDWMETRVASSVLGTDPTAETFPDFPDHSAFAEVDAIASQVAEDDNRTPTSRLWAYGARVYIASVFDDGESAASWLEQALDIARHVGRQRGEASTEAALDFLETRAAQIDRDDLRWKFNRHLEKFGSRGATEQGNKSFDFSGYINTTIAATDIGHKVWTAGQPFPVLPPKLVDSDKRVAESEVGWFRLTSISSAGHHVSLVRQLSDEMDKQEPEAGKLGWLLRAQANLGDVQDALRSFEKWRVRAAMYRREPQQQTRVLGNLSNSLLRGLLAKGDYEGFDDFDKRTTTHPGKSRSHRFSDLDVRREELRLRCRSQRGAIDGNEVAQAAKELMSTIVSAFGQIFVACDASFVRLCGQEWDGLGSFSGIDGATGARATLAESVLSLMNLIGEPDHEKLELVEQLIWGSAAPPQGARADRQADRFLESIDYALYLPRAILEVTRHRFGLDASLELARDLMEKDCAEPVETEAGGVSYLVGNGPQRKIYYPRAIGGLNAEAGTG